MKTWTYLNLKCLLLLLSIVVTGTAFSQEESAPFENSPYPYEDLVKSIQMDANEGEFDFKNIKKTLKEEGHLPGFPTLEAFKNGRYNATELDLIMTLYFQRLVKITQKQQRQIKELQEQNETMRGEIGKLKEQ